MRITGLLVLAVLAGQMSGSKAVAKTPVEKVLKPAMDTPPVPPDTQRQDIVDTIWGQRVADPYRWLETLETKETRAWVDAQDAYARSMIDGLERRPSLAARFKEMFYVDHMSAPRRRGDRLFYTRRHKDKEKAIVYWREGADGAERALLDPNTMSEDGSTSLGDWFVSWDGRWVAYKLQENNADESTMYLRDVASGIDSKVDVIGGAKYAYVSWMPDSSAFYYTFLPNGPEITVSDRPGFSELRFHRVGMSPEKDAVVFPRTASAKTFIFGGVTRSGRYLILYVQHGWNASDVYFKDLHDPALVAGELPTEAELASLSTAERIAKNAAARGFVPLAVGLEATFSVDAFEGTFYVKTNLDAPRYKVYAVDPARPAREAWREVIGESDAILDDVSILGGHFVITKMKNASSKIEVRRLDGTLVREVALPGIGSVGGVVGLADQDDAYYSFSSFTRPTEIYRTSVQSGETSLWSKVELPIDTSDMVVEQVWYPSKDGTRVSMFIVHKKGLRLDGDNPTLLYGYGGFNLSLTPAYASTVVVWLELGGVYAVPNLRGGGEYGEAWHKAGMGANKQNVFDDFIAAAEYLIAKGYTRPQRLAIRGGSNGGLLVGAAMTQWPALFRAVICAVPLLDMVRYHLFGSGKTWVPEYGSAEDEAQFETLYAYSPYHRVRPKTAYPAMLMMAADSDDRVDPMHARKFTALIQSASTSGHPVMMRVERNAGHGGADLVKKNVEYYADQFAFLVWQLGMKARP